MLVLSRKKDESIIINGDIVVTVVEVRGDKIRLGIVAPENVPIYRQEVWVSIQKERAAAGGQSETMTGENQKVVPLKG